MWTGDAENDDDSGSIDGDEGDGDDYSGDTDDGDDDGCNPYTIDLDQSWAGKAFDYKILFRNISHIFCQSFLETNIIWQERRKLTHVDGIEGYDAFCRKTVQTGV